MLADFPFSTTAETDKLLTEYRVLVKKRRKANQIVDQCRKDIYAVEHKLRVAILKPLVGIDNAVKYQGSIFGGTNPGVGTLVKVNRTRVIVHFASGEKWNVQASDIVPVDWPHATSPNWERIAMGGEQ